MGDNEGLRHGDAEGKIAVVGRLPGCDFCKDYVEQGVLSKVQVARVDGKTLMGPWGFMCKRHYRLYGVGLGPGKGQKLVLQERWDAGGNEKGEMEDELGKTDKEVQDEQTARISGSTRKSTTFKLN